MHAAGLGACLKSHYHCEERSDEAISLVSRRLLRCARYDRNWPRIVIFRHALRRGWGIIVLGMLLAMAGCVADRQLAVMRHDLDRMNSQLIQLQVDQRVGQARPGELVQQELGPFRQNIADMKVGIEDLKRQMSILEGRIDETEHQLSERMSTLETNLKAAPPPTPAGAGPTPPPTAQTPPALTPGGAPGQPSGPPPAAASADARRVYQAALTDLQRGKWDLATQGLRAYLAQAPRGDVADTAQYYLAESLYSAKDYRNAIAEFERLVRDFPQSPQVPSALLKTGYAYYEMKDGPNFRRALRTLIEKYPVSKEAKLAEERLKLEDRMGSGRPTPPPRPPTR